MYSSAANFLQKKFNIDAHYFLKGGFWLSLTQIIVIVFGILTSALFAHYLSETEYGIYRYLLSLAILFSTFSLTGIGQSILQTAAKKYYGFYKETISINFIFNIGVLLSALLGAGYYFYNENIVLGTGCLLIALFQPIINSFQFTPIYLQGSGRFRESTILQGLRTSLVSAISLGSLFLTNNIILLAGVYFLSHAALNTISYFWYRPKNVNSTPSGVYNKYLSYAKHMSIRNVISGVAYRLDSIIVFSYLGATELAVYTIATIIPEQIKGSLKNLASLLLPKYAKHDTQEALLSNIPRRSIELATVLVLITVIYLYFAADIYSLLFPKYSDSVYLSQILSLSFPAMVSIISMSALQSQLEKRKLYQLQIFESFSLVFFTLLLTIIYGVIGAITAKVVTRYLSLVTSYFLLYKK